MEEYKNYSSVVFIKYSKEVFTDDEAWSKPGMMTV